jgi:hypothetical protein
MEAVSFQPLWFASQIILFWDWIPKFMQCHDKCKKDTASTLKWGELTYCNMQKAVTIKC